MRVEGSVGRTICTMATLHQSEVLDVFFRRLDALCDRIFGLTLCPNTAVPHSDY